MKNQFTFFIDRYDKKLQTWRPISKQMRFGKTPYQSNDYNSAEMALDKCSILDRENEYRLVKREPNGRQVVMGQRLIAKPL